MLLGLPATTPTIKIIVDNFAARVVSDARAIGSTRFTIAVLRGNVAGTSRTLQPRDPARTEST